MSAVDKPEIVDVTALRMREATIVAGIWITFLVGALGETYVVLTWSRPHRPELAVLFALATAAGAAVAMLPRERIVRSALREPFFLAWTLLDLAMLVIGTIADGGTSSPLVLVFFIPVIFSAMSYPLGSVAAVGVISVASYVAVAVTAGGSSTEFEIAFLATLTCVAAMSAWQAQNHNRQHRALVTASRTDPLTGCLNRRGFEEHALGVIDAMHRNGRSGALLVLDLDHFKAVNDHYGHPAGDRLLHDVSETLEQAVRPVDAVGRLGGDEFSVLFAEISREEADAAAARIAAALAPRAPASLGVAIFPDDGEDLEELTRMADRRLYSSRRGRTGAREESADDARPAGGEPPSADYGKIDLWRAALDASPPGACSERRRPQQMSLQGALLDQIDASVIAIDMGGTVLSWNSGAEALYGWAREEAIARNIRELVVPEDTKPVEQLASDVTRDGRWDGEVLVHHKDGSLFTAYVRNRLILDDAGAPAAIVGVAVDISERKRHEQEQARDPERLAMINRVEAALAEERFVLYAQPIVDLQSGRTVQHELLLRMREPDGRIAPPGEFLPVAEQYALIGEIDWWVLKQAAELAGDGLARAGQPVGSLGRRSGRARAHRTLHRAERGGARRLLVFEITETAIIEDEQAARVFAERLRALGCKIALDDFGTGYGSSPTSSRSRSTTSSSTSSSSATCRQRRQPPRRAGGRQPRARLQPGDRRRGRRGRRGAELLRRLGVDRAQGYHLARPAPFDRQPGDTTPPVRVAARLATHQLASSRWRRAV